MRERDYAARRLSCVRSVCPGEGWMTQKSLPKSLPMGTDGRFNGNKKEKEGHFGKLTPQHIYTYSQILPFKERKASSHHALANAGQDAAKNVTV